MPFDCSCGVFGLRVDYEFLSRARSFRRDRVLVYPSVGQPIDTATPHCATIGLADSLCALGRGGRFGGALGVGEMAGARPARLRHAYAARAASLCVRHSDGAAVPDLRHDHLVCLVRARAHRSILASKSRRGVCSPCSRFPSSPGWSGARSRTSRWVSGRCRGPCWALLGAAVVLCLASWLIRLIVSPAAPGRAREKPRGRGRAAGM